MANAKAQLRAFYAKQGLSGKHRRKAMQHDMRAIRKLSDSPGAVGRLGISHLFMWVSAPQGWEYWCERGRS